MRCNEKIKIELDAIKESKVEYRGEKNLEYNWKDGMKCN